MTTCLPRTRHLVAALLLAPLAALSAPATQVQAQERYELSGRRIAVYNVAGAVQVVPGQGDAVRIDVTRGGADAAEIAVEVRDVEGRQALVLRYPDDQIVYPARGGSWSTTVRIRQDGTFYGQRRGGDRVRVRGSGRGMEAWADLRITVPAGRDLALFSAVGDVGVQGVRADVLADMGSGDATVSDVDGMVEVDTGSGDVAVGGVRGELLVDTGSGDIRVDGVEGPAVTLDTGSGRVEGHAIRTPSMLVDTGSGEVRLTGVSADDVVVDTGSGDVSLAVVAGPERLEVDTGSGDVELRLPADVDATVDVDTGSGRIENRMRMEVVRAERDRLQARVGQGRGRITVDTGSGDITISGG